MIFSSDPTQDQRGYFKSLRTSPQLVPIQDIYGLCHNGTFSLLRLPFENKVASLGNLLFKFLAALPEDRAGKKQVFARPYGLHQSHRDYDAVICYSLSSRVFNLLLRIKRFHHRGSFSIKFKKPTDIIPQSQTD